MVFYHLQNGVNQFPIIKSLIFLKNIKIVVVVKYIFKEKKGTS